MTLSSEAASISITTGEESNEGLVEIRGGGGAG